MSNYRIAGFFRGKNFCLRISRFCGDSRKFYPRKSIFKQLDTALVGVVHWVTANFRKFSLRKSIFKQFAKVFSRKRNPLYGISMTDVCPKVYSGTPQCGQYTVEPLNADSIQWNPSMRTVYSGTPQCGQYTVEPLNADSIQWNPSMRTVYSGTPQCGQYTVEPLNADSIQWNPSMRTVYSGTPQCGHYTVEPLNADSIQWNPSMRTLLGPHESVLIIEVSTFQGF